MRPVRKERKQARGFLSLRSVTAEPGGVAAVAADAGFAAVKIALTEGRLVSIGDTLEPFVSEVGTLLPCPSSSS